MKINFFTLSRLKNFFLSSLSNIFNWLFFLLWYTNFINNKSEFLIVDLDNTVCDTGKFKLNRNEYVTKIGILHSLFPENIIHNHYRYLLVPEINEVVDFIISTKKPNIIFLSARSFLFFPASKKWLRKKNLKVKWNNIILVDNVRIKLQFLNFVKKFHSKITLIDDLSYGHETGNVKLYENEISIIKKTNIDYRGIDFINSLKG